MSLLPLTHIPPPPQCTQTHGAHARIKRNAMAVSLGGMAWDQDIAARGCARVCAVGGGGGKAGANALIGRSPGRAALAVREATAPGRGGVATAPEGAGEGVDAAAAVATGMAETLVARGTGSWERPGGALACAVAGGAAALAAMAAMAALSSISLVGGTKRP